MAVGNTGDIVVSQTSFYGGMGTDSKIGIKNSYADSECLDARKSPSMLTVLPGSRKLVDEDIDGLVVSMTQTPDGIRWGLTTNGHLYKIDDSNDVTNVATLSNWQDGTFGDLTYFEQQDSIYITGTDRVYQYKNVTNGKSTELLTLTLDHSTYPTVAQILARDASDRWTGNGTDRWSFQNGNNGTYTVKTALSENDADKCIFLPDITPMIKISVRVRSHPSSGTLTLTVHDEANNVMATVSNTAANIDSNGMLDFEFAQTKLGDYTNFGTEYHIHLVAAQSGWTVDTYEAGKMYGLHFYYYASMLFATKSGFHPIINYSGASIIIGNGQYIVDWIPSGLQNETTDFYSPCRAIIENGMEITSITTNDEYIVFGCEKVGIGDSRTFQQGMIGFWDGQASTINFKIDCPMGDPKSLYTYQNITYMFVDGAIYAYTGAKALTKIRTIHDSQSEYTGIEDKTDVYNHAMTVRRGMLLMAYPCITNLVTMRHGIYSYGSIDKNYPNSFYYSYNIPESIGNYNTDQYTYQIGGVWNYGDTLYFGYKIHDVAADTDTYNIAIVDNNSLPARNFMYESLEYDSGMPWKPKELMRLVSTFEPLPSGCTIQLKYKLDGGDWVIDERQAKEGDTEIYFEVNKRFKDMQFGIVGANTGSVMTPARITSVGANVRELSEEGKMQR